MYIYPPTSLSVERDRTPLQARNPTSTCLQSIKSIPASEPTTGYRSPSFELEQLGLEQSSFRAHNSQATARHRMPQDATARHSLTNILAPEPYKSMAIHENPCNSMKIHGNP